MLLVAYDMNFFEQPIGVYKNTYEAEKKLNVNRRTIFGCLQRGNYWKKQYKFEWVVVE